MENKDMFDMEWEQELSPENEVKQIQKSIRNRNWKIVCVSVLLAAAVLLVSVFGIIPAVEKLYWNADEFSYGQRSDLEGTLYAYTQLFNPAHDTASLYYRHTGFASYDLELRLLSRTGRESLSIGGTLYRNKLSMDQFFEDTSVEGHMFWRHCLPFNEPEQWITDAVRSQLEELPDYIQLEANLSFREDITMEELMAFKDKYPMMRITWVAIRVTEPGTEWTALCGMSPFNGGSVFDDMYKDYPYFNIADVHDAGQAEQHFEALLQYSADQVEMGRGIARYDDWDIYQNALDYVAENGVMSYGVVVIATPELLLEVMDDEQVILVEPIDGWIDLSKKY